MTKEKLNIAFVHPDLGIGGAERLVCDAALALQSKGHTVKLYTSHHDPSHCFKETADGTLSVTAVGDWLPRHTFKRFYALWAYTRTIYVALYLAFRADFTPDVVICDQVSACIPFLRLCRNARILFYCHFPDMLLTQRKSLLKRLYRLPIDWLEETTTGLADSILVNSKFTAQIFRDTFTSLSHIEPVVLYPSLNFDAFKKEIPSQVRERILKDQISSGRSHFFLSINRYERKKNLGLALNALKAVKDKCTTSQWGSVHLIMAGGYDERVIENKEYYLELQSLALNLGIKDHITFLRSFSDDEKLALLELATCLLYTPSNEHFGIVPIESMFMMCPVIACNSGGPLETVKDEVTGYLSPPKADEFASRMMKFVNDEMLKKSLGMNGRERVLQHFSFEAFTGNLDETARELVNEESAYETGVSDIILRYGTLLYIFLLFLGIFYYIMSFFW